MSNGDWNRCAVTHCYSEEEEEEEEEEEAALFGDPQNKPSAETNKEIELTIQYNTMRNHGLFGRFCR